MISFMLHSGVDINGCHSAALFEGIKASLHLRREIIMVTRITKQPRRQVRFTWQGRAYRVINAGHHSMLQLLLENPKGDPYP
jgi:hypothetical protein